MFPPIATDRPNKRSLRALLQTAVETAVEFTTLGEASNPGPLPRSRPPAAEAVHPHRRSLRRPVHARRPGEVTARAGICTAPTASERPSAAR